MLKKICMFMAAFFVMLLSCAGPIMSSSAAASGFPTSYNEFRQYFSGEYSEPNDCKYVFFTFDEPSNNETWAMSFFLQENKINNNQDNGYYIEYSNNILVVRYNIIANGIDYYYGYDQGSPHVWIYDCYALQLNFNNNTGYILNSDGTQSCTWRSISSFTFDNFDTDLDQYSPAPELNLSVSFNPALSGTVSRNQTINGKEYESKTLDMSISNNGETAQWAMFIVPHGESITFPTSTITDNKGFIGNPVFTYVSDEWSSFTVGFLESNAVYAPCTWHTIPSGFQNQTYSISWTQMSLNKDTSYDVVVYGCLNEDATQTNTSSAWDMRPVYTVSSDLSEVEEVYRSTFTISDPAEFNPNYVDEAGQSYPWNPNRDNTDLYNASKAHRDDYGNVVIKGQSSGGGYNPLSYGLDSSNINVNSMFGDTFKLLNGCLTTMPPIWVSLLTVGLSAIVVVAIIKKVTS